MMTKQETSELATQEQNRKECREAGANDENEEKLKKMEKEVTLLSKKAEQLCEENDSPVEETMKKKQIDKKVKTLQELKDKFGTIDVEEGKGYVTFLWKIMSFGPE